MTLIWKSGNINSYSLKFFLKRMKQFFTLLGFFIATVSLVAQPTSSAPAPPVRNAGDVISIYGSSYTNISDVNYNPNWGQSGTVNIAFKLANGDSVMAYTNFNYQGTGFEANPQNASAMEFVHIDLWTSNATNVKFSPIDNSGTGAGEFLVEVPVVAGQWSSVDLPKSAFTGMTWNSVFQLKFDGQGGATPSDIYLDNIYFWKKAVAGNQDATLSDLKVDGATVPGFAPSATKYNIGIPGGAATPQITAATPSNAGAKVTTITQASAVPGDATVLVTAADGTTTATYTVSFFYNSPATAAPDPIHSTVISLFSDKYTNNKVDFFKTSWSQSAFEEVTIAGNATLKYTNVGFNGIETTTNPVNATAMTTLHMDVWTPNVTVFNMKLVSFLGDGFGGAKGDSESNLNVNLVANQWNRIAIPLADFTGAGLTSLADLNQYIFTSTPFGAGILFIDNIYFSNGQTVSSKDLNAVNMGLYPNPLSKDQWLKTYGPVRSIEVFNTAGTLLLQESGNTVSLNHLPQGMYVVRLRDQSGAVTSQVLTLQ